MLLHELPSHHDLIQLSSCHHHPKPFTDHACVLQAAYMPSLWHEHCAIMILMVMHPNHADMLHWRIMTLIEPHMHTEPICCEHCLSALAADECLTAVDFWVTATYDGRWRLGYEYVCPRCYAQRQLWCHNLIPENCQRCGADISLGEYHLYPSHHANGNSLFIHGVNHSNECEFLCATCHTTATAESLS